MGGAAHAIVGINNEPVALSETEVQTILTGMTAEAPKVKISFQLGDTTNTSRPIPVVVALP